MKLSEFLQDENKAASMNRLLVLGGFIISSYCMIILVHSEKLDNIFFGMYLTAFTGLAAYGKKLEIKQSIENNPSNTSPAN